MPNIYIVNNSGHPYDLALELLPDGKLINLTVDSVNPTLVDRLTFTMAKKLIDSSPDDYLLLSGTPVLNAIASALWISQHPEMRLLIWNSRTDGYLASTVRRNNFEAIFKTISEMNNSSD